MKVLLIGATGLLGRNVLDALLAAGYSVRILARHPEKIQKVGQLCEIIEGQLLDETVMEQAMQGCDAIVNCAGCTDMSALKMDDMMPINSHLCSLIVQTMLKTGVKILVHTSTVDTIGYGSSEAPANEESVMRPPFSQSIYALSKKKGEDEVLKAAEKIHDGHIVVVNPGFLVGAYDNRPSSGALLDAAYKRPFMVATAGGKCFVHVADAAQAIVNALTMGKNGQRYILTNRAAEMSLKDFYSLQANVMGYHQLCVVLPRWLTMCVGSIGNLLRSMGIKTQLSLNNIRQLSVYGHYDNTKARVDLKLKETPIDQAISDYFKYKHTLIK